MKCLGDKLTLIIRNQHVLYFFHSMNKTGAYLGLIYESYVLGYLIAVNILKIYQFFLNKIKITKRIYDATIYLSLFK